MTRTTIPGELPDPVGAGTTRPPGAAASEPPRVVDLRRWRHRAARLRAGRLARRLGAAVSPLCALAVVLAAMAAHGLPLPEAATPAEEETEVVVETPDGAFTLVQPVEPPGAGDAGARPPEPGPDAPEPDLSRFDSY